jgi:hypothetical protein
MATVNLGAIKFNWKGAYNNSTAYVVDDVVSSGGSSYVCILASQGNAVSNGTYWNIMSSAGTNGTNGTDLTSTLTTRGDIVYKGASALTRLPKGTAGYYLKQGANDPEWGEVASGGKFGQIIYTESSTATTSVTSVGSFSDFTNSPTVTITPTATSSKVLVEFNFILSGGGSSNGFDVGIFDSANNLMTKTGIYGSKSNGITMRFLHTSNTTSAITYKIRGQVNSSGGHHLYLDSGESNPERKTFFKATEILA